MDKKTITIEPTVAKRFAKIIDLIDKIPFVRGVAMIVLMFIEIFQDWFKKENLLQTIITVGLGVGLAFLLNYLNRNNTASVPAPSLIIIQYLLFAAVFLWLYFSRHNHTIEHKVIAAVENGRNMSMKSVLKQPKENKRCGGVLVVWLAVLLLLWYLLFHTDPSGLVLLIAWSISYELTRLARLDNWLGKVMFAPGYTIQKLTTAKQVDTAHLDLARTGVIQLLKKERITFRQ